MHRAMQMVYVVRQCPHTVMFINHTLQSVTRKHFYSANASELLENLEGMLLHAQ